MAAPQPPLVAHVIYALRIGGLENGLVNIINRCPPQHYRHAIICIADADEFAKRITAQGVEIIQLHKREGHDARFYWRLWCTLWRLRPAIIHSRNLAALEAQLFSIGLPRVKRVHGEHGRDINDLTGTNPRYLALRKFMRRLIDRYVVVSRDLEQWLIDTVQVPSGKIHQIYNGVDHQRFYPAKKSAAGVLPGAWGAACDRVVVGTVGRLSPVKDQACLLRAVALLRDLSPSLAARVRLVIVGDGPLREELQALVRELRLETITWMSGERDDVPALLAAMDIFVLPSLTEGISNTVLEAMASGVPVIATAVGGNTELVEPGFNGALVAAGDPAALSRALAALLDSPEQRRRLGANARERICQRFDWATSVGRYLALYDQVLCTAKQTDLTDAG